MNATAMAPTVFQPISAIPADDSIHHLVTALARKTAVAFDISYTQSHGSLSQMTRVEFMNFYLDFTKLENRLRQPLTSNPGAMVGGWDEASL